MVTHCLLIVSVRRANCFSELLCANCVYWLTMTYFLFFYYLLLVPTTKLSENLPVFIIYLYFFLYLFYLYLYALILYIYLYLYTFCPLFVTFWYLYALSSWCYIMFSLCFLHYIEKKEKNFSKKNLKKSSKKCWHTMWHMLFYIQQKQRQQHNTDWELIINRWKKIEKVVDKLKKLCYS